MFRKHKPELNDCIQCLLDKDPKARLGCDQYEMEILEHMFFQDDQDDWFCQKGS